MAVQATPKADATAREKTGRQLHRQRPVAGARDILAQFPSPRRFVIGALDPSTRACFEAEDFSLSQFLLAPSSDMSIVTRTGLRAWVAPIFIQFQTFELRMSMEGAQFL